MKHSKFRIPSWLHQAERGEDASFEFVTWVPILMFLVLTIAFVGVYWSSRIPARQAATECARMAIATLEQRIGMVQGVEAGQQSLSNSNLNVASALVSITPPRPWVRGAPLTCRVQYRINFGSIFDLNGNPYSPQPLLDIDESVTLRIEPFKSQWQPLAP